MRHLRNRLVGWLLFSSPKCDKIPLSGLGTLVSASVKSNQRHGYLLREVLKMVGDNRLYGPDLQPSTSGRQDDNLENFIDNWDHYADRLMIFLGAGASMGAVDRNGRKLPTALGLRDEIWSQFMLSPKERESDLRLGLLSLEHSSALVESKVGRGPLVEYVGSRFIVDATLWPHSVLPFLKPKALYTTNYDELIELAWQLHGGAPRPAPVFAPPQLNITSGFIPLYKPHGTAQHASASIGEGGIVLTQFDYFAMLEKKREMLGKFLVHMCDNCVVFVGYSFQDMDIASMLHSMRLSNRERHWYAVFPRADANVRSMYDRQYGIRQISRTFSDFMAEIGERLGLIPSDWQPNLVGSPVTAKA